MGPRTQWGGGWEGRTEELGRVVSVPREEAARGAGQPDCRADGGRECGKQGLVLELSPGSWGDRRGYAEGCTGPPGALDRPEQS